MKKVFNSYANIYTLYGVAFGLLFPVISTILECVTTGTSISLQNLIQVNLGNPLLWVIDSAPVWLGLFARAGGVYYDKIIKLNNSLNMDKSSSEENLDITTNELLNQMAALNEHCIISTTDIDGTITGANPNFCTISEYTINELTGSTHKVICSENHSHEFWEEMWSTVKAGDIWQNEIQNKSKSGNTYWVSTTVIPFLDKFDTIYKFMFVSNDITDGKSAIEQLQ